MTSRPHCLERAFQLADSGAFRTRREIERALMKENYLDVFAHLDGAAVKAALRKRCAERFIAAAAEPRR